jgi:hypothetical protein
MTPGGEADDQKLGGIVAEGRDGLVPVLRMLVSELGEEAGQSRATSAIRVKMRLAFWHAGAS